MKQQLLDSSDEGADVDSCSDSSNHSSAHWNRSTTLGPLQGQGRGRARQQQDDIQPASPRSGGPAAAGSTRPSRTQGGAAWGNISDSKTDIQTAFASINKMDAHARSVMAKQQKKVKLVKLHSHTHLFPDYEEPDAKPNLFWPTITLIFGFCFPPLWLYGIQYLDSPSKRVRVLGRASVMALVLIGTTVAVIIWKRHQRYGEWPWSNSNSTHPW